MTFDEAKNKLAQISGGRYRSIGYELTTYGQGSPSPDEAKCRLYIDPRISICAATWEAAFRSLDKMLNPLAETPNPEEAPGEEIANAN